MNTVVEFFTKPTGRTDDGWCYACGRRIRNGVIANGANHKRYAVCLDCALDCKWINPAEVLNAYLGLHPEVREAMQKQHSAEAKCKTCGYWQGNGYTFAGNWTGSDFGDCLYSETDDGEPLYDDALCVGAGKWGQGIACTHPEFSCPRWCEHPTLKESKYR